MQRKYYNTTYNNNYQNIKSMLDSQAEQIKNLNTKFQDILENQNNILQKLEENNKHFVFLKTKQRIKSILYLSFFIFIFYYFGIYELMLNCYDYYYHYLDLLEKIPNITQNTETIQSDVNEILQKQKQILNLTYNKSGTHVPFTTPVKPYYFF